MAKTPTIKTIGSGYASKALLNDNFVELRDAFENTLSLDGSTPNAMQASLDLNGNDIINTGRIQAQSISVNGQSFDQSLAAAQASASASATSAFASSTSANEAAASAAATEAVFDDFDDRYLGTKAVAPTLDNDGDPLALGALYFDSQLNAMQVYGNFGWTNAASSVNGTSQRQSYVATAGQTNFAITYDPGYVDVYLNGVKLVLGTDFTAVNGSEVVLTTGASVGDTIDMVAYGTFGILKGDLDINGDFTVQDNTTLNGTLDVTGAATFGAGIDVTGTIVANGTPLGGGSFFKGDNGSVGNASGVADIFRVNNKSLNANVTIDATENASTTGPLEVATGVTLTVTTGGNLSIV